MTQVQGFGDKVGFIWSVADLLRGDCANTWPTAIDLVNSGRVDLDRLVTGTYGLAEAAQALTAGRRDQAAVKAVVRPGE